MSLYSICQSACASAPIAVPSSIVGNTDETAIQLLALANDAGDDIARRPRDGWVMMIREFRFTSGAVLSQAGTVTNDGNSAVISGLTGLDNIEPNYWVASGTGIPKEAIVRLVDATTVTLSVKATIEGAGRFQFGQSDYPLPGDFLRPVDDTFWDRTRYWAMRGPMSPREWQIYKSSLFNTGSIERRFRFRSIYAPNGMSIGVSGIGTGGIGDLWQWRKYLSIDPTPFDPDSHFVFEYVSNGWCMSPDGVPQNEWKTDVDVMISPDFEYLMRLSLKWRLLERLGLAYAAARDEYETQIDKAVSHDGGMKVLSLAPFGGVHFIDYCNVPETGYGGRGFG